MNQEQIDRNIKINNEMKAACDHLVASLESGQTNASIHVMRHVMLTLSELHVSIMELQGGVPGQRTEGAEVAEQECGR